MRVGSLRNLLLLLLGEEQRAWGEKLAENHKRKETLGSGAPYLRP